MNGVKRFSVFIGQTFAIWALLFAVLGYFTPTTFAPLKSDIVPALGIIMFGMGLTLQPKDFSAVVQHPLQVLVGVLAQFIIMPLLALLLTKLFHLDPIIALGVILVGCCPGGTSSNVITYLSKGDVALSVTITSITTLLAPFVTPFLLQIYAGHIVNIDALGMMAGIAKMVILPIVLGVIVHYIFKEKIRFLLDILPLVSVAGIVFIIAVVVALSHQKIAETGVLILGVVVVHNLCGYALGFLTAKLMGFERAQRRAIMVEVGMQNSGLGATLASVYFAANPLAAVPSAIFSVWHNISGALLANLCNLSDRKRA